jgi:hypothetical protein
MSREPGIYADIPEADYHADRETLSHSGAKLILRSPAHYRWRLDHPEHKDAFDFGTAAHALVLGVGVPIVPIEADSWRTKRAQELRDEARSNGHVPLLEADYGRVQAMADVLSSHDLATDYKTAASSEPNAFVRAAAKFGYHSQHAWYLDLARDLGHPAEAFAFIVQEKEPPYVVTVVELPPELVDAGRARNRRALERFRDCTESGLWPGYVADYTFAQPAAPRWALYEEEAY